MRANGSLTARLALAFLLALVVSSSAAHSAGPEWQPNGLQLSNASLWGAVPQVLRDGQGGSYVVWRDRTASTVVQRLTATGAAATGWPVPGVVIPPNEQQELVAVLPDGSGGVFVVLREFSLVACEHACEERSFRVRVVRIAPNGSFAPGWPAAGIVPLWIGDARKPFAATHDLTGGLVIAWLYPWPLDAYATRVDGAGTVSWTVPLCTAEGEQKFPAIVPDGSGGTIAIWQDGRHGFNLAGIYALRLTASGAMAPGWQPNGTPIAPRPNPQQIIPLAAPDGSGGTIIAWGDFRGDVTEHELYAQRVMGNGQVAPGWPADGLAICLGPQFKRLVGVIPDDDGGAIAGWLDWRHAPTIISAVDFYLQRVSASGASDWTTNGVRVSPAGDVSSSRSLTGDGAGGAYAVWAAIRPSTYMDIHAGHVLAAGSLDPTWPATGISICAEASDQLHPFIDWDGANGAIVAWQDRRDGTDQVFAQRVTSDAIVPVLSSVVSASATPTAVRLTWFVAVGGDSRLFVLRNAGAGFLPIAEVFPDGSKHAGYEDRDVRPGARYGYRLAQSRAGVETLSPETWIDVPGAPALMLDRVWPNPSRGDVHVSLGLVGDAPGTLEILDLAGRRILIRDLTLGPGRHVLSLPEGRRLPAGFYAVRLTEGHRSLARPLVIAR